MKTTCINIQGMSCESCVASARQALQGVGGVRVADVDLAKGSASVEHDDGVEPGDLVAAVEDAGYDAQLQANDTLR